MVVAAHLGAAVALRLCLARCVSFSAAAVAHLAVCIAGVLRMCLLLSVHGSSVLAGCIVAGEPACLVAAFLWPVRRRAGTG